MTPKVPTETVEELTMNDLWDKGKTVCKSTWSRTPKRIRVAGVCILLLWTTIWLSMPTIKTVDVPHVHLQYEQPPPPSPYNESKVALLIENRPVRLLAPLMLHFMSVVPPDWKFRFMGSTESVKHLNKSMAIREQVSAGKLDLTYIPSNMSTTGAEQISRFLTNLWLYEVVLQPAEWLLVFQTDSILCANSRQNLNDYLDYDWIGAPWNPWGSFGGNGGLSLRKVSTIVEVLRDQLRVDGSEPEDVWLAERLGNRKGAKMADGSVSLTFSGEMFSGMPVHVSHRPDNETAAAAAKGEYVAGIDDWRDGFYEPMGYHTGGSGTFLHPGIWGTPQLRKHIWTYCPEVKMTLNMDVTQYVPGECNLNWKRDLAGDVQDIDAREVMQEKREDPRGYQMEIIDGVEYPVLPPSIVPW